MDLRLQFFGGRGAGAGSELADGPRAGGGGGGQNDLRYGQPNTPQMRPPAPTIEGQIGKKGRPISAIEAIKSVNPDRNAIDAMSYEDYTANCQRCAVAFELNRRGYNVEAEATYKNDPYPRGSKYLEAFKGVKKIDVGASNTAKVNKKIIDNMSEWGNGSRAVVEIYNGRSGHAFNVEYSNGKLYYYDAQTNTRYDPKRVFNNTTSSRVQIARVDNLPITDAVRDIVRKKRR